jgi:NADPH-dependent glutamate synthase beta subunit-like oxidoreductase
MMSPLLFDLTIFDLYHYEGIQKIHHAFLSYLKETDREKFILLQNYYQNPLLLDDDVVYQNFCIDYAPILEDFISYLFNIFKPVQRLQESHHKFSNVLKIKRFFIQRIVLKDANSSPATCPPLNIEMNRDDNFDIAFAQAVLPFLENTKESAQELDIFIRYAQWAIFSEEGQKRHTGTILFNPVIKKNAKETFFDDTIMDEEKGYKSKNYNHPLTEKFSCSDVGISFEKAVDQSHYCLKCHPRRKDSCRVGFSIDDKKNQEGCPLDEKISAMMVLKDKGYAIGALAVICIDNPMVAATGHRICNDCRQTCIFQKQEAVNVPGVESNILKNILDLPYGFEIYSLFTRWNPLNINAPLPKPVNNYTTLIVGQGPAGFSLAHYLMREGIQVLGIDGCKIEPLPLYLTNPQIGIHDINDFLEDLDDRTIYGFGGVAEYGITLRWNKNNLMILRLILERNPLYNLQGGIHFGSNITEKQAFELGFDHIALCMGAGSPKILDTPKKFPKGVRLASDFLMSLQLTGAFKTDTWSNLTVNMPIIVIGGGLTAIDTATEAQRYYLRQIEKIDYKIDLLKKNNDFNAFFEDLSEKDKKQLDVWLEHARELNDSKIKALVDNVPFTAIPLLQKWGGTTVIYRKEVQHAPSFDLNVEEVQKALEEGIFIKDQTTPLDFISDELDELAYIKCLDAEGKTLLFTARTALIAIGTEQFQDL